MTHVVEGRLAEARAALEAIMAEAPHDAVVLNAIGAVRYEAGDWEGARAALERCVATAPNHPLAHATLGELALRRRDLDAARRHFAVTMAATDPSFATIQRWVAALIAVAERQAGGSTSKR